MLVASLRDWEQYDLGPVWRDIMRWVCEHPDPEPGVYDVVGCAVYVADTTTRRWGEARYEYHRRLVDVQIAARGEADIYVMPLRDLQPDGAFDEQKDIGFCAPAPGLNRARIGHGNFVLLLPTDGHMPAMAVDHTPATIRTVIAKIPVERLTL